MFPVKFLPSAHWRLEKRKDRKKWKISIFRRCPKLSLILSEHVLNLFWGNFFRKKIAIAPCRVEAWKKLLKKEKLRNFQNCPKTFPKTLPENVLIDFFDGKRCAQWTLETQEKSTQIENFKLPEPRKTFPKVSKLARGNFFDFFLPSAPWRVETWKNFKKLEKFSFFRNAQIRSQKCSNMFSTCFEVIFLGRKFCPGNLGWSKLGKF